MRKNLLVIIIFFIVSDKLFGQIPYETSKAALIYQFALNTDHEKYKNIKVYTICFLGDDIYTYRELQKIVANKNIKGKPVKLKFLKNLEEMESPQLLYINRTLDKRVQEIWTKTQNKNILLVTEQATDKKYIMLNILYDNEEEKISFEINKANLIIEQFSITSELLLFGGKEVDIRELYQDMREQLEKEKREVEHQKEIIRQKIAEISNLHLYSDSLSVDINKLLGKINKGEYELKNLTDSIAEQREILRLKLSQIEQQEKTLEEQKQQMHLKEIQIQERTKELQKLISESNKQKETILLQEGNILNKNFIIETKNKQLMLTTAMVLLFVLLAFITFYAFHIKRKTNINLEQKQKDLENTLKQLKDTQNRLVQSEKMASLGVLTAGIAHEINNPINYINSGIEGLSNLTEELATIIKKFQAAKTQEELKKILDDAKLETNDEIDFIISGIATLTKNIKTGVTRTTEIIKSLNTFSRIDKGDLQLKNIQEIIDSSITLLKNQYKNRIEIIKNYRQIPQIYCYPGKLNQVFINLISNAIHSIKNKGQITIETKLIEKNPDFEMRNSILISIKDTGQGIDEKIINKIFEPFFTTKEVGKGTGLGLSITHGIIEQHNGRIFARNIESGGAEFIIYLPLELK